MLGFEAEEKTGGEVFDVVHTPGNIYIHTPGGKQHGQEYHYDDDDDDDDGYPAHSHHDKFPPWWDFVRDDDGGNLSVTKSHH